MFSGRNPDKLEAKALQYEQKGKTAKALKYRQKAARIRGNTMPIGTVGTATTTTTTTLRTPQIYEQNALKWEQRGNWQKAQKNREKVWRLQNPQYANYTAPMFYNNSPVFLGYNVPYQPTVPLQTAPLQAVPLQGAPLQGVPLQGAAIHNVLPPVVETHLHPTIVEQTTRPEKILEVQPIVHRQVDAPQVRVIEQHTYETVPSTGPGVITNTPIVEETVRPKIIEEIQPVVHRNVPAPFVERVEQHVTEHITQPTTMTKQVINDPTLHTAPGLAAGGPVPLAQPGLQQNLQQPNLQQPNLQQPGLVQQTTTTTTKTL